jgi:TPR repeat protein
MTVPLFFIYLTLLFPMVFARAADSTNAPPPATSQKSPEDIEDSPEWVKQNLLMHNSEAVLKLAAKYATGDGVPQDGKKAVDLFVNEAAAGSNEAEYFMGLAFARGIGVAQNDAKAMDWMNSSAGDGFAPAQSKLGQLYLRGPHGQPDYASAFAWNSRAVAYGYAPAQADLGRMYEEGLGVERDIVEAFKWLQLAVTAGNKNAIARLNEVASLMDSSQKQEAELRIRSFKPLKHILIVPDVSTAVTVPLGSYFQIPVKVFGETNFMMVDTGATGAILDLNLQNRLGEPLAKLTGSTISTPTASFTLWDCPDIFIGGKRFTPLLAAVEDFRKVRQTTGDPIHGIVGFSCLKYEVLGFDSDNHTFSLGGSVPEAVKRNALAVPLIPKDNYVFCIEAFINGRGPVLLAMDTGDVGSIDLNESDWKKVFPGRPPKRRRLGSLDGAGNISDDYFTRLDTVTIGTNTYTNLISATVANPLLFSRFGQAFVQKHVCYVDFPNRMLYLQPGRNFARPEEDDMSGLRFLTISGKITVGRADDDSPAYVAGIRTGDEILSLNGHDAASLPLQSIRDTLKTKPGDEITMQIKHGEQTNSVKFLLKRLL